MIKFPLNRIRASMMRILSAAILSIVAVSGRAQSPLDTIAMRAIMINQLFPQERVYLQFDNTSYYLGETMWFKAQLFCGADYSDPPLSRVLYVELCAPEGYVTETKKYKLDEQGRCYGEFELHESLLSGYYEVRAYTRYILNRGDEAIFSRVFPIYDAVPNGHYEIKEMLDRSRPTDKKEEPCRLSFYPEGGHIVADLESRTAFELTDDKGRPVAGTIAIYEDGREILRTAPWHNGKGHFTFTPRHDAKYRAEATIKTVDQKGRPDEKNYKFPLPSIVERGLTLAIGEDDKNIYATIRNNFSADSLPLGLAILHDGYIQYLRTFSAAEKEKTFPIATDSLPAGVNRAIIFTRDNMPLAERMFFVCHDSTLTADLQTARLKITANGRHTDSLHLRPLQKITLKIESADDRPLPSDAALSLSVTDAATREKTSYGHTLYTHMLLGSEIKGYIPDARRYFDPANKNRKAELNLIMLTHGWTAYDWQWLTEKIVALQQPIETGLTVKGTIYNREKNTAFGELDTEILTPRRFGRIAHRILSDSSTNTPYTGLIANKNGNFNFRAPDFYGTKIVEIRPFDKLKSYFVLDRIFSPTFRPYNHQEYNQQAPNTYTVDENDSLSIRVSALEYKLARLDVSAKKRGPKMQRPPHSEIRHNFLDEWEYARDITFAPKIKRKIDIYDENTFIIDPTALNNDIAFSAYAIDGKDLPTYKITGEEVQEDHFMQTLKSTFRRHKYDWAYWVQCLCVDGEYTPDAVPNAQWENIPSIFKEFTIRSDWEIRRRFTNSAKRWADYKNKDRTYPGFTTRLYITPQEGTPADGFPGKALMQLYMQGNALEWEATDARGIENPKFRKFERHRGTGYYSPRHPNYVACFIPYKKNEAKIHSTNNRDIRYTALQGYSRSKKFYSPDYSQTTPADTLKDHRRTLLWHPAVTADSTHSASVQFHCGSDTRHIIIEAEGLHGGTVYSNLVPDTPDAAKKQEQTAPHIALWHKLSKTNSDPALLAKCYRINDKGIRLFKEGKFDEAVQEFRKAAAAMYPSALANLGVCYSLGRGVEENIQTAYRYFKFAADLDNPTGLFFLGDFYLHGTAGQKNDTLAFRYFKRAAEKNYSRALGATGNCYKNGTGVQQSYDEALRWYQKAIAQKDYQAMYEAATIYAHKDSVAGITGKKLRKSPVADLMMRAARHGILEARLFLADCYATGKYFKKSKKNRFKWLEIITRYHEHEESMLHVAYCYEKGLGVSENQRKAYRLYKKLADKGNAFAKAKIEEYNILHFFDYDSPEPPGMK